MRSAGVTIGRVTSRIGPASRYWSRIPRKRRSPTPSVRAAALAASRSVPAAPSS